MVCICLPTYNAAETIRETLGSILAQTYTNLVVHISDNASTDETLKIIESMADSRIYIHCHEKNIGAEANFTCCIEFAEGKYTAIFHSDDLYEPQMLEKQVAYLEEHAAVGAVFTEAMTIDERGIVMACIGSQSDEKGTRQYDFPRLMKAVLLHHNFLICPSALVRTSIYKKEIKQWRGEMFRSSADLDTWLRIARKHSIAILGERLMRYRISKAQFSNSIRNRTETTDFFLVMDHYIMQPEVRAVINEKDRQHYVWLSRHEKVARALNLFVLGRLKEAKKLLHGILSWDCLHAAIETRRGLVTLFGVILLQVLIFFRLVKVGKVVIGIIKKVSWK